MFTVDVKQQYNNNNFQDYTNDDLWMKLTFLQQDQTWENASSAAVVLYENAVDFNHLVTPEVI